MVHLCSICSLSPDNTSAVRADWGLHRPRGCFAFTKAHITVSLSTLRNAESIPRSALRRQASSTSHTARGEYQPYAKEIGLRKASSNKAPVWSYRCISRQMEPSARCVIQLWLCLSLGNSFVYRADGSIETVITCIMQLCQVYFSTDENKGSGEYNDLIENQGEIPRKFPPVKL